MLAMTGWNVAYAQIPDGSLAPDFDATDLNDNTYNLYTLLDQGYTVYLDISATWCGPCWNYHNSGALETIWDEHGPGGTNEAYVFMIEGDASTNEACLYGPSGCVGGTQGDWVSGTNYPIIHLEGPSIANAYQISYYPTIFMICPGDSLVYEVGQLPATALWNLREQRCAPPALTISVISTRNEKCYDSSTGAINVNPAGGVPPYTYSWSNGATTQDLNNIPAGTYTVTVYGQFGTEGVSDPIEVEGPPSELTLEVVETTPVGCNGILGSATVQAQGGWDGDYVYKWANGQNGETAFNLAPGSHIVSVTDEGGCVVTTTVVMATAVYPTATIAAAPVLNCNQPTLQLNATGSSSGPDIEYQWFASNGGNIVSGGTTTTPLIDAGGSYTIQVLNTITTCASYDNEAVIADLNQPAADAGPAQNISCTNPQATLQGTGSSGANFTYLWTAANGGNIVSGETTLNPVVNATGNYTLKVTNTTNGCTQTATTNVTGTPAPQIQTNGGSINCIASSVTLTTTTNAVSPTFSWTGPNNYSSALQSPTVEVSGTYNVVVTDSITTCTSTATALVISNTNAPGASATGGALTCVINNVTIQGTTPDTNATFAWTGPNGFVSSLQNPTVSEAGAYQLVVTDTLNGCTSSATAAVVANTVPPIASAIAPGNLNCNTSQIQLNGTGSTQGANITYAWTASNGGNIVSGADSQTPLVDAVGTYSILVTNTDNGCTQTASANVAQSAAMNAAITNQSAVLCNGGATGQATATGLGGNGVYNYAWSNGGNSATITGLAAGSYQVVVTDGENCSAVTSVVITQPDALQAQASATAQSAFGVDDGSATATPTGGTGAYSYAWSNGESTQSIGNLAPGVYQVVVTDANGCTALESVTVNSFNCFLAAEISGQNAVCNGAASGNASVEVSAGAQPIQYAWSNGETTPAVNNLSAGLYTVNITDANNCPATLSIIIGEPAALFANAVASAESALGANDGSAAANPTGGNGNYTYAWSNGEQTAAISNLAPGTYTVIVTDQNGCTAQQTVEVTSFLCAISSNNSVTNVSCAGAANGAITVALIGGTAPFTYAWSNGGTTATISGLSGGAYTVQVLDANGCEFSTQATVAEPLPFGAWDIQTQNPVCPNDANGSATAAITGGTEPYTFVWNTGAQGNTLSNVPAGAYTVQVTDLNGCQSTTSVALVASDSELPSVSVQNATLALNSNGTVQVTLGALNTQFGDNCGIAGTSLSPQTFSCEQLGPQTVTVVVTDLSGNTASATATVMVVDITAPVLTCPENIQVCAYDNIVEYAAPVAEDNCLLFGAGEWNLASGLPSGAEFPTGLTNVIYTYTDAGGNTGSCSFNVNVTTAVDFTNVTVNNDLNSQNIGSIDITVEGGTGPFLFLWTDESGNTVGNTEDVEGLGEGAYAVQITDANGCVYTRSDIRVENTSRTKEPEWLSGVRLQPNPTSGLTRIVFSSPVNGRMEISVIDATGRVLRNEYSEQQTEVLLDCSDLPGGVYSVRFRTGSEVGVRKLVVSQ
jgi:hypothetical protein